MRICFYDIQLYFDNGIMKRCSLICAAVMSLALCLSCSENREINPDPAFADYVAAYTGGLVSGNSAIRVKFTKSVGTGVPPEDLFKFSPSLNGEARWASPDMLEFVPETDALRQGRRYNAEIDMTKLFDVSDSRLKTFRFSFTVARKKAEIVIDDVFISRNEPGKASVRGRVLLSEPVLAETAKELLYAEGAAAGSVISLNQSGAAGVYDFTCSNITRKGTDEKLTMVFDAYKAGFGNSISASVTVPGTDVFKVVSVRNRPGAEPCMEVAFSSPLDPLADLNGLFVFSDERDYSAVADGNIVKVAYAKGEEDFSFGITPALKDYSGRGLGTEWHGDFQQDELKPAVKLLFTGSVLPDDSRLVLPFKAVNLNAIDVKIIKIYQHNVLSFLQSNDLNGDNQLRRSGRLVYSKKISLDNGDIDLHRWHPFCIDLSGLMKKEKGAIYRVQLSFRKEYSVYGPSVAPSAASSAMTELGAEDVTPEENDLWDEQNPYYYDNFHNWDEYDWKQRNNPMHATYYMMEERFPSVNLMTSDLGIVAKYGESGTLDIYVHDIISTAPEKGVTVEVYGYQLQLLCSGTTDSGGRMSCVPRHKPFAVVARTADAVSYLKMADGRENSLSRFDVGGVKSEKGLRGYIYGERGVWRPGDTMHLTLIVKPDAGAKIPSSHPATLELYNSKGQFHSKVVCPESVGGFYTFDIPTSATDPTGTYNAYVKLGGATFHKSLPVEYVKANRLKVNLTLPEGKLVAGTHADISLSSSWLTGPAASGLRARTEMKLRRTSAGFRNFGGYIFNNPLSDFEAMDTDLFSTVLDSRGNVTMRCSLPKVSNAPGMLKATLVTRVTEPGGEESVVSTTVPYSPFDSYVGVRPPDSESLETDKDYVFSICNLDSEGRSVKRHRILYTFYKLDWSWWWQDDAARLAVYVHGKSARVHDTGSFVSGGNDAVHFRLDYPDYGNYLLYVKDLDSGHSTGVKFFCDWPAWRGLSNKEGSEAASMLTFSTDKKSYSPSEEAVVYIPAAKDGRAIVTVENGSGVIFSDVVKTAEDRETKYKFKVSRDMAPNFYVGVTLLNPYGASAEGLPLRMYGVRSVDVTDDESRLLPQIFMPDDLAPQKEFSLKVSEKSGRPMAYTIAIVDEGLLDISGFRTPDPWAAMNAKVALGVKTWDLYDDVAGAYGGSFSSMFRIGGDVDLNGSASARDNRFEPVVLFAGPFKLDKGTAEHRFTLPMYSGRVRVMVVAASGAAFGNAEKSVPVRSPLMMIPTLPERIGTGEKTLLPVNLFVTASGGNKAEIFVETSGALRLEGEPEQVLELAGHSSGNDDGLSRDAFTTFRLSSASEPGAAQVTVTARYGSHTVRDTLSLAVENVLPATAVSTIRELAPGDTAEFVLPEAVEKNSAIVGAYTYPSLDANLCRLRMMDFGSTYTGQMAGAGVALINLRPLIPESLKAETDEKINALLSELCSRQLSDGSFSAWKASATVDMRADAMTGHFLTLAAQNGYSYPSSVFSSWRNKTRKSIASFMPAGNHIDEVACHYLDVMALSGNAQEGVMNRVKDSDKLSFSARCMLSAAYAHAGRKNIASSLLESGYSGTGSYAVDALALRAYVLTGNMEAALPLAAKISSGFSDGFYSTAETAYASEAFALMATQGGTYKLSLNYESIFGLEGSNVEKIRPVSGAWTAKVPEKATSVRVVNTSAGPVYVSMSYSERPQAGTEVAAAASSIGLQVTYTDADGKLLGKYTSSDEAARKLVLEQGTDFTATFEVTASPLEHAADLLLRFRLPSGCEFFNDRFFSEGGSLSEYCDIRDDEALWYFNLPRGTDKSFSIRVRSAYAGEYTLPQVTCESSSDGKVFAHTASSSVKIVPANHEGRY